MTATLDYSDRITSQLEALLPLSADWMASTAPLACTGGQAEGDSCRWYHGVWQYLRLFGLVSSPTWHDAFYQHSLMDALKGQASGSQVLISGTADYSMLAYVLEANNRVGAAAHVRVIDRCPTPLIACQWYACKQGSDVQLSALDIEDTHSLQTKFNLIVADAFLTRFEAAEAEQVLATWYDLLQEDGRVVTTVRVHQNEPLTSDEEIERFVDKVRWAAADWGKKLTISADELIDQARSYAQKMRSNRLGTVKQLLDIFEVQGFTVTSHELASVRGELRPSQYLRIVAKKYGDSKLRQPSATALLDAVAESHIVPLKFAYTGAAAQKHLDLARLDSYKEVTDAAIVEAAVAASQDARLAIYDIGPGDGQHTQAFLRELMKNGRVVSSYLGLDFSTELAAIAEPRVRAALTPKMAFRKWDIETVPTVGLGTLPAHHEAPRLVTFLGQTLGNVEDPVQTLQNIRNSVSPGDQLLLSIALQTARSSAEDYLRPYQNETFMESIAEPLRMVGLDVSRGKLLLTYEDGAVVGKFTLLDAQTIERPLKPAVTLPEGTAIRCFLSRRFRPKDVEPMLHAAGWNLQKQALQNEGAIGVYLAVARPTDQ